MAVYAGQREPEPATSKKINVINLEIVCRAIKLSIKTFLSHCDWLNVYHWHSNTDCTETDQILRDFTESN